MFDCPYLFPYVDEIQRHCGPKFTTHAALYRITPLLEQISTGIKKNGLLRAIQSFPDIYAPLFVYVGEVSVEDVLNAVYIDFEITVLSPEDERTLSLLKRFITEADSEGNVLLVHHFQLKCQALSSRTLEQITPIGIIYTCLFYHNRPQGFNYYTSPAAGCRRHTQSG